MNLTSSIPFRKIRESRKDTNSIAQPVFGSSISDHMFICQYKHGQWLEPAIIPFGNLSISPAALALHYGQSVFEGMKAFPGVDGRIRIFRMEQHYRRFKRSLERMCMPAPDFDLFQNALTELVRTDIDWVPAITGGSLYIRPFMFASEGRFGVKVSDEYHFVVFTGPVPALFAKPIRVKVETDYIRAAPGGTGFAKCAGNYGAAFLPTQLAREQGYDQVIWTSGGTDPMIEESGVMNIMFVVNDTLITPALSDTILAGVTRDSLLHIARSRGWQVEERAVAVDELATWLKNGQLQEAFGAGTAAVVAPIGCIAIDGVDYELPLAEGQSYMMQLKAEMAAIRSGAVPDRFNWNHLV